MDFHVLFILFFYILMHAVHKGTSLIILLQFVLSLIMVETDKYLLANSKKGGSPSISVVSFF